jgi:TonB-dependent SusC/RagA subfamily outer membrane receptor
MTSRRPRHPIVRAAALGALGTALVVAACETPSPTGLRPATRVPVTDIRAAATPSSATGQVTAERVRAVIQDRLPAVAKGTGAAQMVWIVEDSAGRIVQATSAPAASMLRSRVATGVRISPTAISPTTAPTIDANRIASVEVLKLAAGRVAPDSVGVVWMKMKGAGDVASVGAAESFATATTGGAMGIRVRVPGTELQPSMRTAPASGGRVMLRAPNDTIHPIYIVDGTQVVIDGGAVSALDHMSPDKIASVEVLKGDSAIARYGERGRNGVVIVTTKQRALKQY